MLGNMMMDEPETPKWGGNICKSLLDDMAVYVEGHLPDLAGRRQRRPPGYRWRASERFHKLDFVRYQYNWLVTSGNSSLALAVLDQARKDGVAAGVQPQRSGWWHQAERRWSCACGPPRDL